MIELVPIQQQLFTPAEAMVILSIEKLSTLEALIANRRLTPIRVGKENRFALVELTEFAARELVNARRLKGTSDHGSEVQN